jgi:predicted small metal-binding protein
MRTIKELQQQIVECVRAIEAITKVRESLEKELKRRIK